MAMYFFATRLSSAVCARRNDHIAASKVRAVAVPPPIRRVSSPQLSPVPSTSATPVECSVVVEHESSQSKSNRHKTHSQCSGDTRGTEKGTGNKSDRDSRSESLQRNCVGRASVGPCSRHKCDAAVQPTSKHRVRFANTFPRVNRKKRMSDSFEEWEVYLQNEDEEECPAASKRTNELVFRDSNLVSGSLEALVQRLVPLQDNYPDRAFFFAFLLSSRLFIRPAQLLGQIVFLWGAAHPPSTTAAKELAPSGLVRLLAEWMETFPYDFRDDRVMAHVRAVIHRCAHVTGMEAVSQVLQALLHRLTALERHEAFLKDLPAELASSAGKSKLELSELCSKPEVLAQQLTMVELERLSYIGPEEFIQAFAREAARGEERGSAQARNLEAYVAWSHRLTYLVATEIVKQTKKKKRVKVMELWVSTAQQCFSLGNFNSLMSILSGLNLTAVTRLRKSWAKVGRQKLVALETQMNDSGDFSNYREILKAENKKFTSSDPVPDARIIIPFFSLFLKDVFVLQEACSKRLPNGHINFERFWQMAKLITEFITWQQVSCEGVKHLQLSLFLQAGPLFTEAELSRSSFLCEPPGSLLEQEQWKTLKCHEASKVNY